jgi:membrane-bound ClpP family serine protease
MTVAYINFHAPINQSTVQQLMATCGQLLKEGKNELYLMLSTPGGRVDSGVTL